MPGSRFSNGDAQPPEPLRQRRQRLRGGGQRPAARASLSLKPLRSAARQGRAWRTVGSAVLRRRRKPACSASSAPPSETRGRAAAAAAAAVESVLSRGLRAASPGAADAPPLGGRALSWRCEL